MRGRKPTPTNAKKLAGNPGKRPLNLEEPTFGENKFMAPRVLNEEARQEWNRVANELREQGLLTVVDRAALTAYCHSWSQWMKAVRALDNEPLILETDKGYRYPNPLIGIANSALASMKVFMVEFGMTPSSRARVKTNQPEEEDELTKLLFGGVKVPKPAKAKSEDIGGGE